jgi:hypothetical protein
MKGTRVAVVVILLGVIVSARPAAADNTTQAEAVSLMVGQMPLLTPAITDASPERWYKWRVRAGRSYCVEVSTGDTENNASDSTLEVLRGPGTLLLGNDDAVTEPDGYRSSRICYISSTLDAAENFARVQDLGTGSHQYRIRVVETTLFSDWFYVGADYSAYTLIRNTTDASVTYRVNWRNAAGAVVATTAAPVAGNADVFFDARAFAGALAATNGSVEIAHNGSPDAIVASTTVLSPTTGLSFDAPFMRRQPW